MYAYGRARADRIMHNNEEQGRATNNGYTKTLYRRFVLPLADMIREDLNTRKAGVAKAHVKLLAPLDPDAVAFLAVRGILTTLLNSNERHTGRYIVNSVGRSIYHELLLKLFEHINPALFHALSNDFKSRLSTNERHRMTVFKMKAKENGIEFPEWGVAGVTQVGAYLVNQLECLGMIQSVRKNHRKRQSIDIELTDDVLALIATVKEMVRETMPYHLPCVEAPRDWVAIDEGGYHTDEMRRMQPYAVTSTKGWDKVADQANSVTLRAMNALQRTRWAINRRMLAAIKQAAQHFDMDEIISQAENPAPPVPSWLTPDMKPEQMSEGQTAEFVRWKAQKRDWYTERKLRGGKFVRLQSALRVADMMEEYPAIYFLHFADFRGRLYANSSGVTPQGSDLQRSLLHFADGKPLDSLEAEMWFTVHGANKWGYDKDSLEGRVRWVKERHQLILAFAEDPIANNDWRDADSPLQFLAWCFEYADWHNNPDTFVSHLPVGMDGTCNGLQNFSAMLRDAVGGEATNLLPSDKPNDIYQKVADVTGFLLRQTGPDEHGFRDMWLKHGLNRTLVKRSVMTLPYGSTRFACADFIVEDYLKQGKATEFPKDRYNAAAQYLSHFVWEAISEVVVKAKDAMDWLQAASGQILKDGGNDISWVTPSGFPVVQTYLKTAGSRIRTSLCGNAFLRIGTETDEADKRKHRNGIAPNFVHSMDAAHLQLTTVAAVAEGMSLAMIHDDYGTHAADCGRLSRIIRETFVAMYENNDPLADFATAYGLKDPPEKGNLDLREVLKSTYFFA